MILKTPRRQTLRPPRTISSDEHREPRDRALEDLAKEKQWIDFVKRLNYTIEDMVGKK